MIASLLIGGGMSRPVIAFAIAVALSQLNASDAIQRPKISQVWDQSELDQMDVPVAVPAYSQSAVSPDYYYRIPVTPIYKSYPVYAPGRGPVGYMEKLKRLAPELAFNPTRLKTKEDWIRAGEIVFDAPTTYDIDVNMEDVANPAWYAATGVPIASDGSAGTTAADLSKGEVRNDASFLGSVRARRENRDP
ncbi:MAG: hypothetical protein ACRD7E_18670 [Bryobacteraceae bacterium]